MPNITLLEEFPTFLCKRQRELSTLGALRAPAEARSAEATSSQNWDLDKMRYSLYKVRMYFETNPDEEI